MAVAQKAKALVVTAPLVAYVSTAGTSGHLYRGDVVSEAVSEKSVEHLRELGYVTEQD